MIIRRVLIRFLPVIILFALPCISQGQAKIVLQPGVVNQPYSQNISDVLRDKYRVTLKTSSGASAFEWKLVGAAPSGLTINPTTGDVFGTPSIAKTHLFRVQVLDRSLSQPAPLTLLLSLQITAGEAPVLVSMEGKPSSIAPVQQVVESVADVRDADSDDVEIPSVVPRKDFTLPIKIKNDAIRQLEVVARNKAKEQLVTALTPADLPRGEVLTSVKLALEEGDYAIDVIDASSKHIYKSFDLTVRPTDVDALADVGLAIKHSGFVPTGVTETPITIQVGPKVQKISIEAFEKEGETFTKALAKKIKAPSLTRDTDTYPIIVPLAEKDEVTRVVVTDLTPGTKLQPKTIDIKHEKSLNAKEGGQDKEKGKISIDNIEKEVKDTSSVDAYLTIAKGSEIEKIRYDILKDGTTVYTSKPIEVKPTATDDDKNKRVPVIVLLGRTTIRFYDVKKPATQTIAEINCTEKCPTSPDFETTATPFTRAIVGIEQVAASSANSEQKLFLEFNLTAPLFRRKVTSPIEAPLWVWLNPRITGVSQTTGSVAEFATAANFFAPFVGGKVNDIVQGFGFIGGIEIPFKKNGSRVTAPIASGFGSKTKARYSLSFIAGVGAITPGSAQKSLQVFKINSSVTERFPDAAPPKEFIAFVSPDRNRFLRQYFGGLRLKTYFVKNTSEDSRDLEPIFPGIIDITFGQNESITRGRFRGGVVRIEGIYPLPFVGNDNKGLIYAFGSVQMKLTSTKIDPPIFLELAQPVPTVPAANVFVQQLPALDRDVYKIGVGVDLIRLLRRNQ